MSLVSLGLNELCFCNGSSRLNKINAVLLIKFSLSNTQQLNTTRINFYINRGKTEYWNKRNDEEMNVYQKK